MERETWRRTRCVSAQGREKRSCWAFQLSAWCLRTCWGPEVVRLKLAAFCTCPHPRFLFQFASYPPHTPQRHLELCKLDLEFLSAYCSLCLKHPSPPSPVPAWVRDPSGFPKNPQQSSLVTASRFDCSHLLLVWLFHEKDLLRQCPQCSPLRLHLVGAH